MALVILLAASLLFLVPVSLVCLYYLLLVLVRLFARQRRPQLPTTQATRFAIVIPAHNEQEVIANTLRSCGELDYRPSLFDVYVIADNCSDQTAEIVRQHRVQCWERFDKELRGKGYALRWAFERLLPLDYDALIVVDADCEVDRDMLRVFDARMQAGDRVLQANYLASNPDESGFSYIVAVANWLENEWFYRPKASCNSCILLRGTGMAFRRDVLQQVPWGSHSIVEDLEYTLELLQHDIAVKFVPEVSVRSPFPVGFNELRVQRERWLGGGVRISRFRFMPLLVSGVLRGRLRKIDAGWTLLANARSLILTCSLIAFLFAAAAFPLEPSQTTAAVLGTAVAALFLQGGYFGLGVLSLGLTARRMRLLLAMPATVFFCVWTTFVSMAKWNSGTVVWQKTPR